MASILYNQARQDFLDGAIDMNTDVIRVRAVADEDYTASAAHTAMTSVTKYTGTTDATIDSPTITSGVFDAADESPAYSSLAIDGAKDIDGLVIFKFVTDDAGSTPICYIDLTTSVTPNGGDINIAWNGSGIFSIGG